MLLTLPSDISLYILSFLSIRDLASLLRTSHQAHGLIEDNHQTVYHQAAILHQFAPPSISLSDTLLSTSSREKWLDDVTTWKEFCKQGRRWTILERNWDGRGSVMEGGFTDEEGTLHFRVDEEQKTILTISNAGRLAVRAMEDFSNVLWQFSEKYIARRRMEYSQGFLVFPSTYRGLEVWRRSADVELVRGHLLNSNVASTPIREPSPAAVLDFQFLEADACAKRVPLAAPGQLRGRFTPHAYLGSPNLATIHMMRLKFPLLAVIANQDWGTVWLFDVQTGALLQKISIGTGTVVGAPPGFRFPAAQERVVMDIDVTEKYLCVGMHAAVVVVPWRASVELLAEEADNEARMLVLSEIEPPSSLQEAALQLRKVSNSRRTGDARSARLPNGSIASCVAGMDAMELFEVVPPSNDPRSANSQALIPMSRMRVQPCFVAARFSPDGRHFAAVTVSGLLYLIADFARVERGAISFDEIARRIYLGEWLRDLVWEEQQRRLLVQSASEEIFLIDLDSSFHDPYSGPGHYFGVKAAVNDPFSHISVFRLSDFSRSNLEGSGLGARLHGSAFRGAQVTRTTIWKVWDVELLEQVVRKRQQESEKSISSSQSRANHDNVRVTVLDGSVCFVSFTPGI
ncbi:uncharacterized protein FIBRA_03289 [Fibroporia radiculosa]|uniref:F-box domain-containing protein n=1 Tax=Fibroporia radiculosa TaxID=599839 RepID=J4GNE3_9APHY|nr:uncharacterized protein FIBRA_03289 [Fibroporia radiculosa]CCM01240.1 predicted protein [Fibroporia radiculosa]